MCKGDHQEVSNQTAQTYTKRYVHPKSRRHYSTALKIKKGEEGKGKGGTTSQITFCSVNVKWQMDFFLS